MSKILREIQNWDREKNVEFVDLVKRCPMRYWSRRSASMQRRTDRSKFEIEKKMNLTNRVL